MLRQSPVASLTDRLSQAIEARRRIAEGEVQQESVGGDVFTYLDLDQLTN